MRPSPRVLPVSIGTAWLVAAPLTAFAQYAHPFDVGVGVDFSSGDYGTGIDTDILSVPVSVGSADGPLSFKLTVPYVRVNGASNAIPAICRLPHLTPLGSGPRRVSARPEGRRVGTNGVTTCNAGWGPE